MFILKSKHLQEVSALQSEVASAQSEREAQQAEIEQPHADVHNSTHHVFDLIGQQPLNYESLMEVIGKMESGSDGVFSVLDRISSDVSVSNSL